MIDSRSTFTGLQVCDLSLLVTIMLSRSPVRADVGETEGRTTEYQFYLNEENLQAFKPKRYKSLTHRVLESNPTDSDLPTTNWWVLPLRVFFTTNANLRVISQQNNKPRTMKFIAFNLKFAVVASLFALAVADSCPGRWCLNKRTGLTQACCPGSTCQGTVSILEYCS